MKKQYNKKKNITILLIIIVLIIMIGMVMLIIRRKNNDYMKFDFSQKNDYNSCGDNAYYIYDKKTHTVTIMGYGVANLTKNPHYIFENLIDRGYSEYDYDMEGELLFPSDVERIIISEGITEVRNKSGESGHVIRNATYENLKEIILPNSLTKLGKGCFAFQTNLEKINIPDSIKAIPAKAFYECRKINRIDLPKSIEIIGYSAFRNCNKLYYINFPKSIRVIQSTAFDGCATLPEVKLQNIRFIGTRAFEKCYNLKNIEINGDIPALYSYTFEACLNLTNVKLTKNIKYIAKEVWRHSKVLEEEKLFENRKIIGNLSPTEEESKEFENFDMWS